MSISVQSLVWNVPMPRTAKQIATALAWYADENGASVYPGLDTVAEKTDLAISTVKKWQFALEYCGVLNVIKRSRGGPGCATIRAFDLDILRRLASPRLRGEEKRQPPELQLVQTVIDGVTVLELHPYAEADTPKRATVWPVREAETGHGATETGHGVAPNRPRRGPYLSESRQAKREGREPPSGSPSLSASPKTRRDNPASAPRSDRSRRTQRVACPPPAAWPAEWRDLANRERPDFTEADIAWVGEKFYRHFCDDDEPPRTLRDWRKAWLGWCSREDLKRCPAGKTAPRLASAPCPVLALEQRLELVREAIAAAGTGARSYWNADTMGEKPLLPGLIEMRARMEAKLAELRTGTSEGAGAPPVQEFRHPRAGGVGSADAVAAGKTGAP